MRVWLNAHLYNFKQLLRHVLATLCFELENLSTILQISKNIAKSGERNIKILPHPLLDFTFLENNLEKRAPIFDF